MSTYLNLFRVSMFYCLWNDEETLPKAPVCYSQISQNRRQLKAIFSYISILLNLRKTIKYETMFMFRTRELFKFNGAWGGVEKQYKWCGFWQPVGKYLSQEKQ